MREIKPQIGQQLYGYCGGIFGRDFWGPATVEVANYDYVVVRDSSGILSFDCTYDRSEYLFDIKWTIPEEEEDNGN